MVPGVGSGGRAAGDPGDQGRAEDRGQRHGAPVPADGAVAGQVVAMVATSGAHVNPPADENTPT
ncbi:hypothetical protein Adu01nite_53560 [Paractinoplanes durhamensis]|uniref:Uncharacterized protein n=1 Tax=Paractinoplanes durhamensis TaxID=113563 RepID=A0ABQ3Z2G0_9ACTN|nr:hypothetical protein Adu01nite_53560 [Actinoplanes durhamensis]